MSSELKLSTPFALSLAQTFTQRSGEFNQLGLKASKTLEAAGAAKMFLQATSNTLVSVPHTLTVEAAKTHEIPAVQSLGYGSSALEEDQTLTHRIETLAGNIQSFIQEIDAGTKDREKLQALKEASVEGSSESSPLPSNEAEAVTYMRVKMLHMLRALAIYSHLLQRKAQDFKALEDNWGFPSTNAAWMSYGVSYKGEVPREDEGVVDSKLKALGLQFQSREEHLQNLLTNRVSMVDPEEFARVKEELQQAKAAHRAKEQELERKEKAWKEEKARLEKALEDKTQAHEGSQRALTGKITENSDLNRQIRELTTQIKARENYVSPEDQAKEIRGMQSRIDSLNDQVLKLERELKQAQAELKAKEKYISPEQLAEEKAKLQREIEELKGAKADVEKLTTQLDNLKLKMNVIQTVKDLKALPCFPFLTQLPRNLGLNIVEFTAVKTEDDLKKCSQNYVQDPTAFATGLTKFYERIKALDFNRTALSVAGNLAYHFGNGDIFTKARTNAEQRMELDRLCLEIFEAKHGSKPGRGKPTGRAFKNKLLLSLGGKDFEKPAIINALGEMARMARSIDPAVGLHC